MKMCLSNLDFDIQLIDLDIGRQSHDEGNTLF